jgi:hypothetical protein
MWNIFYPWPSYGKFKWEEKWSLEFTQYGSNEGGKHISE